MNRNHTSKTEKIYITLVFALQQHFSVIMPHCASNRRYYTRSANNYTKHNSPSHQSNWAHRPNTK